MKTITITTRPPAVNGEPVFLHKGKHVDTITGLNAILALPGWSKDSLAEVCGVSRRTVDGWFGGRPIATNVMNVLTNALADA